MPPEDNPDWAEATVVALDTALKLQSIRARLDLSQKDLARLLGIPRPTLQNWEQRRTEPEAFALRMIDVIYDDPEGMRHRLDRLTAA